MKASNKKGFTMIELLVVLLIVGILAAVAAPIYLANVSKAKASEAVAVMSQIRQAERELKVKKGSYQALADGDYLANDPDAATNPGLGIDIGANQYFSDNCYTVVITGAAWSDTGVTPAPIDFIIKVDGAVSEPLAGTGADPTHGAAKNGEVSAYDLEMDNSGRIYVNYGDGAGWKSY